MLIETSPTIGWVSADHWPTISRSWADFPSTIGRLIDQCNDITSILFQVGLNSGNTNKMFGACDTAKSLPSSVVNSEREVLRKKLFKVAAKGDLQELDNLLAQQVSFGVQDFDKRTPLWVKQKLNLMFRKLTEIVLFNHSPAEGKKQTSRRDPRLFSYMIPMISIVTFLVKNIWKINLFRAVSCFCRWNVCNFKKTPAFVIFWSAKLFCSHVACMCGNLNCVKFLLRQPGVDIHARDRWKASPLSGKLLLKNRKCIL